MVDIYSNHVLESHQLRLSILKSKIISIEIALKGSAAEQHIQNDLRNSSLLKFDNNPYAIPAAFISYSGDIRNYIILPEIIDLLHKLCLINLIGQFGEDNRIMTSVILLDLIA